MNEIELAAIQVGELLTAKKLKLVTAESCTGGMVAAAITEIAGSSQWFERGFVTYSNSAKQELLNVENQLILKYGAVSQETAIAMAEGAIKNSYADVSIAVTGIAGPGGGSTDKPVGTVWFAWKLADHAVYTSLKLFTGNRSTIRKQATHYCLIRLLQLIQT